MKNERAETTTNLEYKLTSKLNAKLKRVNKHLNKFGGRDLI